MDRDVGRPCSISIHALHEESDVLCNPHAAMLTHISIHALHEESDQSQRLVRTPRPISIHALHEESDSLREFRIKSH